MKFQFDPIQTGAFGILIYSLSVLVVQNHIMSQKTLIRNLVYLSFEF